MDLSEQHAYEARQAFLAAVSYSEARMDLAEAALQISAEDDAIASHTVVRLPVGSYLQRLAKLSEGAAQALSALPPNSAPEKQIEVSPATLLSDSIERLCAKLLSNNHQSGPQPATRHGNYL